MSTLQKWTNCIRTTRFGSYPVVSSSSPCIQVWLTQVIPVIILQIVGFGLLESGSVSAKDEVNIMVKNVVDVVFGGLSYWSVGFGLSYGDYEPFRNAYVGFGKFFYDPTREFGTKEQINQEGWSYASFLFQLSLATTASTIVSGLLEKQKRRHVSDMLLSRSRRGESKVEVVHSSRLPRHSHTGTACTLGLGQRRHLLQAGSGRLRRMLSSPHGRRDHWIDSHCLPETSKEPIQRR